MNIKNFFLALFFLILCTTVESFGDATMRNALAEPKFIHKTIMFFVAAGLLFGYGLFLNLAPIEFDKVVGLYIATLFIVWQIVSYFTFGTIPTIPTLVSGTLIVVGGCLLTFWK